MKEEGGEWQLKSSPNVAIYSKRRPSLPMNQSLISAEMRKMMQLKHEWKTRKALKMKRRTPQAKRTPPSAMRTSTRNGLNSNDIKTFFASETRIKDYTIDAHHHPRLLHVAFGAVETKIRVKRLKNAWRACIKMVGNQRTDTNEKAKLSYSSSCSTRRNIMRRREGLIVVEAKNILRARKQCWATLISAIETVRVVVAEVDKGMPHSTN